MPGLTHVRRSYARRTLLKHKAEDIFDKCKYKSMTNFRTIFCSRSITGAKWNVLSSQRFLGPLRKKIQLKTCLDSNFPSTQYQINVAGSEKCIHLRIQQIHGPKCLVIPKWLLYLSDYLSDQTGSPPHSESKWVSETDYYQTS